MEENDGLPRNICDGCLYKCCAWQSFKKQCEQSEQTLRQKFCISYNNKSDVTTIKTTTTAEPEHSKSTANINLLINVIESEINEYEEIKPETTEQSDVNNTGFETAMAIDIDSRSSQVNAQDNKENQHCKSSITEVTSASKQSVKFTCEKCLETFRNADRLASHLRIHLGQKPEICKICEKEFNNLRALRRHRLKHNDMKQYKCMECDKMYKYQTSLTLHKKIHQNIRHYVCDLCGKSFVRAHGLQSHMLSHSTETPFNCQECGKKFKNQAMLRNHQIRHQGIKRFICSDCGKTFTTSAELNTHNRTHTGKAIYIK